MVRALLVAITTLAELTIRNNVEGLYGIVNRSAFNPPAHSGTLCRRTNISHKLVVPDLQEACMDFLFSHAAGKPIKALRIAEIFDEEELYREASRFVLDNPGVFHLPVRRGGCHVLIS